MTEPMKPKGGLEHSLYEKLRPGAKRAFSRKESQAIVAMLCSAPPPGKARWSVRVAAEEAVKRGIVNSAARDTIRRLMKEHDLKPWREKNVVHS
jgi:putative transposase